MPQFWPHLAPDAGWHPDYPPCLAPPPFTPVALATSGCDQRRHPTQTVAAYRGPPDCAPYHLRQQWFPAAEWGTTNPDLRGNIWLCDCVLFHSPAPGEPSLIGDLAVPPSLKISVGVAVMMSETNNIRIPVTPSRTRHSDAIGIQHVEGLHQVAGRVQA